MCNLCICVLVASIRVCVCVCAQPDIVRPSAALWAVARDRRGATADSLPEVWGGCCWARAGAAAAGAAGRAAGLGVGREP